MRKHIPWTGVLVLLLACTFGCAGTTEKKIRPSEEIIFYPPFPQRPRLQFLTSITQEKDLGVQRSAFDEFLLGKEISQKTIGKPYDIGTTKGKIFILDKAANQLIFIDLKAKNFDYLKASGQGALDKPAGIWVGADGAKYIADFGRKQVVAFDPDNDYLNAFGSDGIFGKPVDVAVHQNQIYVCDMEKNQVMVLDKTSGELLKTFGEPGQKDGQLWKPTHLFVDHQGHIFVNDAFNFRVQEFDGNGNFIKAFGKLGDTPGSFARPKGLAVSRDGHIYVVDAAFENVQIFDEPSEKLLLFFGGQGDVGPGDLYLPCAISIDYENVEYFTEYADPNFQLKYLVYVGNLFGDRKVNVYGFGDWIGTVAAEKTENGEKSPQDQ